MVGQPEGVAETVPAEQAGNAGANGSRPGARDQLFQESSVVQLVGEAQAKKAVCGLAAQPARQTSCRHGASQMGKVCRLRMIGSFARGGDSLQEIVRKRAVGGDQ